MSLFDITPSSPTDTVNTTSVGNASNRVLTLYNSLATLNNLAPYVPLSGSVFSTFNRSTDQLTFYIYLASGSATSLGNSGSRYHIDWSPNNTFWFGTGSNSGYTGSIAALGVWTAIQVTGSAPYWRVVLVNCSGSSISGSVVALSR